MGIAIQDLLALEFFKDFYVVAGKRGLGKEIQGVTVLMLLIPFTGQRARN